MMIMNYVLTAVQTPVDTSSIFIMMV